MFEGFGTSGKNTFNGIVSAAQTLGEALKLATQSPIALWNGFLDLLDSVQSKIQGVGTAIASSPIGALAGGLKAKFGGKSATVVDGVDGAEFDQKIQAIAPPEQPKRMNRLRSFFSKPVAEPLPSAGPQPFIRVDDPVISPIQPTISDRVGSMFSAPKPIAPQDNLQVTAGTSPTTEPIQPTISDQVRSVFPAPKPIAPQATPQATADNSLTSSPIAGKEALMGATDTVGALSSVASIVAPNFAGPLEAIGGLLSSVLTLTTVIPVLSGTIATLATGFTAAGGITGLLSLGMTGLSSVFGTVTATATAAWAAVTGPLLPIVAAIALVVATVGLVYVAFQNNFLGIADLVGGVVGVFGAFFGAIVSGFSEIFGGIVDQLQQSIGGIFTQLQVLGQVIVKPFEPLMTLFGGGGDGLGSAIAMTVGNALIPFKIMATAIGFVVGTIGKVIEVVVAVGTVIADIILQPMSAIVGVVATVFSAIGRLGSAIMQPFSALGEAWDKLTGGIAGAGNESAQFGDMIRSMANNALLPLRMVFGAIGLAISGVGFAVEMLIQGFTTMAQVVLLPVTAIGFLINGIVAVGGVLGTALTTPLNLITGLFTGFITMLGTIPAILMQPFNAISGIIGGIASAIALVGSAIAGIPFIGGIFSAITGVQAAPQQETQYFADGGRVQGSGVGDRVDAKLTPGEFVVTPGPATAALPLLEALNAGGVQGMLAAMPTALPQMFPAPIAVPVAAGAGAGGFGDISVNLNVENITIGASGSAGDSPQAQAMEILDQLAPHLRRAVADILRDLVEKTR